MTTTVTTDDLRLAVAAVLTCADAGLTTMAATTYPDRFVEVNPIMDTTIGVLGLAATMLVRVALGIVLVLAVHHLSRHDHRFPIHPLWLVIWLLAVVVAGNVVVLALA